MNQCHKHGRGLANCHRGLANCHLQTCNGDAREIVYNRQCYAKLLKKTWQKHRI